MKHEKYLYSMSKVHAVTCGSLINTGRPSKNVPYREVHTYLLTLKEGASGIDINARPYKNPFKGPFGPIFFA